MPAKQYQVKLDQCQRDYLIDLISSGIESARKLTRARILLKADEGEFGPAYDDKQIKEAVEVSIPTIERTRKTFRLDGLTAALNAKKRTDTPSLKNEHRASMSWRFTTDNARIKLKRLYPSIST